MTKSAARRDEPAPGASHHALWQSEIVLADLLGRLIEFWGFKRNMGRVWAVLYLSPSPLTAQQLRDLLDLSAGAVSMTLSDLSRWGVVRKLWVPGERRDYFAAEVNVWKMISRVFAEREGAEIGNAIEACEQALQSLEPHLRSKDADERARAELQRARIHALLELARLARRLLDMLLQTARVDAEPLAKIELAGRRAEG
jgi:DNA-binding transcriptional regulator GbsR (MarR family)